MFRSPIFEQLECRHLLAPVVPAVETAHAGGAADDLAIWLHPVNPSESRIIGAIKSGGSSLEVYRLDGTRVQTITAGDVNNVDLRYNFPLSGTHITLLAGSDRSNDSLALYRVDDAGLLTNIAARTISTGIDVYGCTMYVSSATGTYYVFVSSESGIVQQWELLDAGNEKVDARLVRSFDVGRITEGMVADDSGGYLYAAEEDVGIWRYAAEPDGGESRRRVDVVGHGGHLRADVEGLAIYYRPGGNGYLIASSQGSNDFVVYQRTGDNAFVGRFEIVAGGGIDAVADTDGIDVTNVGLGTVFPDGLFVAQDSDVNFKLVHWEAIAAAIGVAVDTRWDPRTVGATEPAPSEQGDFNGDEVVDAIDYTVWRNQLGKAVAPYVGADADGNGIIGGTDYLVWKANFEAANLLSDQPGAEQVEAIPKASPGFIGAGFPSFEGQSPSQQIFATSANAHEVLFAKFALAPLRYSSNAVWGHSSRGFDAGFDMVMHDGDAAERRRLVADQVWSEAGKNDRQSLGSGSLEHGFSFAEYPFE